MSLSDQTFPGMMAMIYYANGWDLSPNLVGALSGKVSALEAAMADLHQELGSVWAAEHAARQHVQRGLWETASACR